MRCPRSQFAERSLRRAGPDWCFSGHVSLIENSLRERDWVCERVHLCMCVRVKQMTPDFSSPSPYSLESFSPHCLLTILVDVRLSTAWAERVCESNYQLKLFSKRQHCIWTKSLFSLYIHSLKGKDPFNAQQTLPCNWDLEIISVFVFEQVKLSLSHLHLSTPLKFLAVEVNVKTYEKHHLVPLFIYTTGSMALILFLIFEAIKSGQN